ncbi:efflux RND transporter periplasmic adaptor subunit [Roseiarcaceae bacterium H3SJ34-1]|uniref:efflux RND transporter periplasmic adaptor subunit n=1 Tax=Terripilifer ovatus TaxID=3032367 RepID=UPI003AB93D13|nr:efflux RND transporter periplasmic adaptor subunit [Roseiarcaceae bacterium H3SJ34-1]
MMRLFFNAAVVTALLYAWCAPAAWSHEGHDHESPPPGAGVSSLPRAEATSQDFELVAVARDGKLTIYLDRFGTNEPVINAAIEVDAPDGQATARLVGDVYEVEAAWTVRPGNNDLLFTITTPDGADVLSTTLVIGAAARSAATETSAGSASTGLRGRLTSGGYGVFGIAALGFLLGILVMALATGRRRLVAVTSVAVVGLAVLYGGQAWAHEGEDHGDAPVSSQARVTRDVAQRLPDRSIFVPKTAQRLLVIRTEIVAPTRHARSLELPGRIIPDPNASGYVQAAVSGRLSQPPGGFPRLGVSVQQGDILAYVTPPLTSAESSDQRQRQGELDQQISIVERRLARYEKLAPSGAVARVQVDETRSELEGLRDRRTALDRSRRQPEALVAPVSGVVAAVNAIAGQIAETNALVFQIIDPHRLWVEALSFEALNGVTDASLKPGGAKSYELEFKGSGLSDKMQSLPVHFAVSNDATGLRVGQLVTVFVQTSETTTGIALPRSSVVTGANGQSTVYEHTQAERFEPREVRVMPLDAERVLIAAGLDPGRRIVTQGAELLNQVR